MLSMLMKFASICQCRHLTHPNTHRSETKNKLFEKYILYNKNKTINEPKVDRENSHVLSPARPNSQILEINYCLTSNKTPVESHATNDVAVAMLAHSHTVVVDPTIVV